MKPSRAAWMRCAMPSDRSPAPAAAASPPPIPCPTLLDCVRAYATLGEICDAMRAVLGTYQEVSIS